MSNQKITTKQMVLTGVMAAVVFATNYIRIMIPTPIDNTAIHVANVACLLSAFLLGPLYGGLSAGIGSAIYDLTNPLYLASAPFTLVFKFIMAFVCGKIAYSGQRQAKSVKWNIIGAISGALSYVVLYLSKNFAENVFFKKVQWQTAAIDLVPKALTSTANAVIAVVIAVPLALAIFKAMKKANI